MVTLFILAIIFIGIFILCLTLKHNSDETYMNFKIRLFALFDFSYEATSKKKNIRPASNKSDVSIS